MQAIEHGQLAWQNGQPYSSRFNDVYYNSEQGLLETDYVFLQANRLAERWASLTSPSFSIAETGFGTGLNFILAAKLWLELAPNQAKLHFISAEKYPLSRPDLITAWQPWSELNSLSNELISHYPQTISQSLSLSLFKQRVKLSLLIGDATAAYQQYSQQVPGGVVDAWFLDGFAPAKNPAMWQAGLFQQMALLSNASSTFATFTSASAVRRGLMAAGFKVNKRVGFGKKREMLYGQYAGANHNR